MTWRRGAISSGEDRAPAGYRSGVHARIAFSGAIFVRNAAPENCAAALGRLVEEPLSHIRVSRKAKCVVARTWMCVVLAMVWKRGVSGLTDCEGVLK